MRTSKRKLLCKLKVPLHSFLYYNFDQYQMAASKRATKQEEIILFSDSPVFLTYSTMDERPKFKS